MAFQIRATAVFRFVNFLTGFRSPPNPATPAKLFQIWTRRSAGQLAATLASSFSLAKCSWPSGICSAAGKAVIVLSASIANSRMRFLSVLKFAPESALSADDFKTFGVVALHEIGLPG